MKVDCFSPRGAVGAVVLLAVLFAGCETKKQARQAGGSEFGKKGSGEPESTATADNGGDSPNSPAAKKFGSVSFSGLVKVTGASPAAVNLDIASKPECGKQRQALGLGELAAEKIVVGAEGGFKDCIVFISSGFK